MVLHNPCLRQTHCIGTKPTLFPREESVMRGSAQDWRKRDVFWRERKSPHQAPLVIAAWSTTAARYHHVLSVNSHAQSLLWRPFQPPCTFPLFSDIKSCNILLDYLFMGTDLRWAPSHSFPLLRSVYPVSHLQIICECIQVRVDPVASFSCFRFFFFRLRS